MVIEKFNQSELAQKIHTSMDCEMDTETTPFKNEPHILTATACICKTYDIDFSFNEAYKTYVAMVHILVLFIYSSRY